MSVSITKDTEGFDNLTDEEIVEVLNEAVYDKADIYAEKIIFRGDNKLIVGMLHRKMHFPSGALQLTIEL